MTGPPDLTITVNKGDGCRIVTLRARTGAEEAFVLSRAADDAIRDLRRSLPGQLHDFHNRIHQLEVAERHEIFEKLDEAVLDLRAIGHDFICRFWDTPRDRERWEAVLAAAFMLQQGDRRQNPARVELTVDRSEIDLLGLPIEILPIMDPAGTQRSSDRVRGEDTLRQALLGFPGFAAVVTRRIAEAFDPRAELLRTAGGRVPLKIVHDDSFYADKDDPVAESEVEWLRQTQMTVFDVEPPWPDAGTMSQRDAGERLGLCLLDPRTLLDAQASPRGWADQIQHFSCHYTSTPNEHLLGLRVQPELNLSIRMLNLLCDDKRDVLLANATDRPLVFLNACGSGSAALHGGRSLTDLLVESIRPRAIVATLTPVHFPLAATFARLVYRNLIEGTPLGEAIRLARWSLAEPGLQPFGILYVLFGNPDLHIVPERTSLEPV